jgi:hypothetical protein
LAVEELNWHNIERGFRKLSDELLLGARYTFACLVVGGEDLSEEAREKYRRKFEICEDLCKERGI